MSVAPLHRTLEQELQALLRGASLECLVCGEFVLHAGGMITCPECNFEPARRARCGESRATIRHAGRVIAGLLQVRGKSGHRRAGRWGYPGGESRRKVAQKGDRLQRFSGDAEGKGEKVG